MDNIELTKEEAAFIAQVFNTVKVNETLVPLPSLVQLVNKLTTATVAEKDD